MHRALMLATTVSTMDKEHVRQEVRAVQIFSSLADEELDQLMGYIMFKHFRRGDVILNEDDTNNYMYMILAGRVKVVRTTEDGKEIIIALHKAGDSFGELSLVDQQTFPASVLAIEDTHAAIISKTNFFEILRSKQQVLDNFLSMLCLRLRDSWKTLQMIHSRTAIQRVRRVLHRLADGYGETRKDGIQLNLKLTHQSIADMAGLTREAVTRVIDRLQKDGEIGVNKDRTIVLRPALMKRLSLEH